MERHEILEAMSELKLYGMRASFDEIAGKGLARLWLVNPYRKLLSAVGVQPNRIALDSAVPQWIKADRIVVAPSRGST